ncbi:MAG TPA: carboxypeptidase-like regulatory domain-containing protein [Candidatus Acidoferrum sp.]|nr:carboxypeptidase-like regulatory domain-containing protein [Candidatus Acidoferrum sp.]
MKAAQFWMMVGGAAVLAVSLAGMAAAQDDEGPVASMKFLVVRDYNGKPVKNAAVVLHPVNKNGKQERGGIELKTDPDGKTGFDGIPYGPLRVQVLAQGFQTFGEDYEVNKADMEITVRLKRPTGQYSVYSDHPEEKKPDDKKSDQPAPDSKQQPKADSKPQ